MTWVRSEEPSWTARLLIFRQATDDGFIAPQPRAGLVAGSMDDGSGSLVASTTQEALWLF